MRQGGSRRIAQAPMRKAAHRDRGRGLRRPEDRRSAKGAVRHERWRRRLRCLDLGVRQPDHRDGGEGESGVRGGRSQLHFVPAAELLRKGAIHLSLRQRDPNDFDLAAIARATNEFSDAELDQSSRRRSSRPSILRKSARPSSN